jgi:predicted RNA binding protein YcfA (HicA-like mRNA interferase family)
MPMTAKEIVKLLEANGFVYVSSNGSHRKFQNPETGKVVIVPFHSKDLNPEPKKAS